MNTETAEVLKNLRDSAEGAELNGFCNVYLDNARKGMPVAKFRAHLAQLSKLGLYKVIDGYAWGDVKVGE